MLILAKKLGYEECYVYDSLSYNVLGNKEKNTYYLENVSTGEIEKLSESPIYTDDPVFANSWIAGN